MEAREVSKKRRRSKRDRFALPSARHKTSDAIARLI